MRIPGLGIEIKFLHGDKPHEEVVLPVSEEAYSEDALLNLGTTFKFNPDELIGKKGYQIYRRMMLDEQVKAVVRFKRDAITSRNFLFEVDRDQLGDEEADRRVALSIHIVNQIKGSFTDKLNGILSSMYQGFSLTEKIFNQVEYDDRTYWGIKDLKLKPYNTFEFHVDEFGNIEKLVQKIAGRTIKLDINKFIHFVNNPDYDEQYGGSELREAYRSYFHKDMAIRFWGMWLERHASGFRAITHEGDAVLTPGTPLYVSLQNVLKNTVTGSGVILPKGVKMELNFPENNVAFKEAIDHHDLGIARALLVPNLMGITPTGQTGSFSQSDTQLTAFFMTLNADARRLEEILNEDLFRELGEANFGDDYWPRFKFHELSDKQKIEVAKAWQALVTAGAVQRTDTDEAHLRELLGVPEKGEVDEDNDLEDDDEDAQTPNPGNIPNSIKKDNNKGNNLPVKNKASKGKRKKSGHPDETIIGRSKKLYSVDSAAKRVSFDVIARTTDSLAEENVQIVAGTMDQMVADAIIQMRQLGDDLNSTTSKSIKFSSELTRRLNKQIGVTLGEYWDLGRKHAETEVDKAKGTSFSMKMDGERLEFVTKKYVKDKAFKVAGNLSGEAMAIIQNIIMNGTKGGKSLAAMEKEIYQTFASKGMISQGQAKQALGEALGGDAVADHRIATLLRTNGFEAVNEARFNYFTDPALDGFVQALEYSAILDGRTTQICQHLDDRIFSTGSGNWESYRPPNHYNCRSLLIPVTDIDEWVESEDPTLNPQQGFE